MGFWMMRIKAHYEDRSRYLAADEPRNVIKFAIRPDQNYKITANKKDASIPEETEDEMNILKNELKGAEIYDEMKEISHEDFLDTVIEYL
jgi:hypothetical protein